MDSKTLRKKFLDFFEKNDHVIIPSAPLVPSEEEQLAGKEKVLFTSAGMQQLIPYLMGKLHPKGNKLADAQKCVRTDDIEEVGDATHHTFFEMLGNWSLGDYWKEGAIELSFKFLTEELRIPIEKLAISVFAGDNDAPIDEESAKKWKELGVSEKRIAYLGKEANWWPTPRKDISTGELKNSFGPCGPDTEMFIWVGSDPAPAEFDPKDTKWVEVWNDVFMEFNRKADGTLEELPQKNVDTGIGFERMLAVINEKDNDYETDLFLPIIEIIEKELLKKFKYGEDKRVDRAFRIIADHIKAVVFLISNGVEPSNKDRGYILRRLIRRIIAQNHLWGDTNTSLSVLVDSISGIYGTIYTELSKNTQEIKDIIKKEEVGANKAVSAAVTVWRKWVEEEHTGGFGSHLFGDAQFGSGGYLPPVSGEKMFELYQSYGLHPEIMDEITRGQFDRTGFDKLFSEHQQRSRAGLTQKFAGGLASHGETEIKYHTATHLLHQALRDVLGPQVFQKGSNITSERLRFDFSYDKKMTPEEINKVEDIINERIKQDLKVDHMIIPLEKAKEMNAIGLFDEKYADKVSIYGVGPGFSLDPFAKDQRDRGGYYSLEFCGGPHVDTTGVIGKIKLVKEEAISAGVRRIRAIVE